MTAVVTIRTWSDADFVRAFVYRTPAVGATPAAPIDLSGNQLLMMIRRQATDVEAALRLSTATGELPITDPEAGAFTLIIRQASLLLLRPATYVHSLVRITPEGLRFRMWRGTMVHGMGESR